MIFLVLYDTRGQCIRVAQAADAREAQAFLNVGFVEVDASEYERCATLVAQADFGDLLMLTRARQVLTTATQTPDQVPMRTEPDVRGLERLQKVLRTALRAIAQQYVDGTLSEAQWYRRTVDLVNGGITAATILGKGGFSRLTREDTQAIEAESQVQTDYLNRFRRDLPTLSPAMAVNRVGLYANATTNRYWTAHTRAVGLPLLPAMPGVRTECGSHCKCNWQIIPLAGQGNWNLYWRLSAVESCETCIRRQRVFNPLQIRNGVVQPFNPGGIYKT